MKKDWHPDELARHWSLSPDEHDLLGEGGATRFNFAILLKAFQLDGRFPEQRGDIAESVIVFLSRQLGVPAAVYFEEDWSERTRRHQRAQVRAHCGFHAFRGEDEAAFVDWLTERVVSPNPETEALKIVAYCRPALKTDLTHFRCRLQCLDGFEDADGQALARCCCSACAGR